MSVNAFLASLPAVLGLAGFVIYQVLGHSRRGDEVTKRIVAKLRQEHPTSPVDYAKLTQKELRDHLAADLELRQTINDQDFRLLQQTLRHRFVESMVVYTVTAMLFLAGAILFAQSMRAASSLRLTEFHLESSAPEAKGLAVDLDPLRLEWTAEGNPEDIRCLLENMQSGRRSQEVRVSSSEKQVVFEHNDYENLLAERERGRFNRVRAVCASRGASFFSDEFRLYIGIKVMVFYDRERQELLVTALIDNSSIPNYFFEARVIVPKKGHQIDFATYGDAMQTPKKTFRIEHPEELDWRGMKIAYFGPDDSRIVRTEPMVDTVSSPSSVEAR